MGLAICVGMLAELRDLDPEGVEDFRDIFSEINGLLLRNGLPAHTEPETLPALSNRCGLGSYPNGFLHHLRRAYAYRLLDDRWFAEQSQPGENAAQDPAVEALVEEMESHLVCHSDAEGFYLPIDFDRILFDDTERVPGCMIGSSFRLLDELAIVAPSLGIDIGDGKLSDAEAANINRGAESEAGAWLERIVWLSLFEAARLSIEYRAAICFT